MHRVWMIGLHCALMAVLATFAVAEDWPEFRGPTGQGHSAETGLPAQWSATENVRWHVPVLGRGWSSPIVWQQRIYLTSAVPREGGRDLDQTLTALCLDAQTGETLWSVPLFEQESASTEAIHPKNSHASSTPITDGRFLFVHFGTQGTACLTLDGDVVWKSRELKYAPQHGNGSSPVLVDDLLFVSCDGSDVQYVAALDRQTGKLRWKTERPANDRSQKFSFSTPLVIEVDGQQQIVSPGTNAVVAYAPQTGAEIWKVRYDGYSVIPRPVFEHGLVFISTSYQSPTLLAIRPDGQGDVTDTHVAWRADRSIPNTPSLLVVGDEIYSVSDAGHVACYDARTGNMHWQKRIGGNYSASPVYADGKIYIQSETGDTTVIEPGTSYKLLAKNSLGAATLASFAIADRAIFIRTDGELFRIEELGRSQ